MLSIKAVIGGFVAWLPVASGGRGLTTASAAPTPPSYGDVLGPSGFEALSARMDPEDLREVISAYQKCVAETVRRFGGFVAKYMGDGVLVYLGYPQAHEDDAERAVRGRSNRLLRSIGYPDFDRALTVRRLWRFD